MTYHYTKYQHTVVTETSTEVSDFTGSLFVTVDLAARLPTNAGSGAAPTENELNGDGGVTVTYAQTVYAQKFS